MPLSLPTSRAQLILPFAAWVGLIPGPIGCSGASAAPISGEGGTTDGAVDGDTTILDGGDAGDAGYAHAGSVEFAPYFPAWTFASHGYAYTGLANLHEVAGVDDVTLAFVLATPDAGCVSDLATDGILDNIADIHAFIAAGGHAKISFGGAQGLYLEDPSACTNAVDLANAIGAVIDTTGITDLDFDIEQPFNPGMSDAANENLGKALYTLQQSRNIVVGLTLQHSTLGGSSDGLDEPAQTLIRQVVAAGTQLLHVNVMTMGYGPLPTNTTEAARAIATLNAAQGQLKALIPGLSEKQAWAMLGVIPEIGANDDTEEIFTPEDVSTVAKFARDHEMGLAAFWSIDRDRVCSHQPCGFQKYSTVNTSDFQFTKAFMEALRQ